MPQEAISSDPCFESNGMAENWEKILDRTRSGRPAIQSYKDLFIYKARKSRYFVNPLDDIRSRGERSHTSGQDK